MTCQPTKYSVVTTALGDSLPIVHVIYDLINEQNGGRRHHLLSRTTLKKESLVFIILLLSLVLIILKNYYKYPINIPLSHIPRITINIRLIPLKAQYYTLRLNEIFFPETN